MKLRLSILLLAAAALAAAPAAGQTIKSLGYNTTNGNIVAATNVTFTNSVGFASTARAATRTNLSLGTFKTTDNDIFSEIYSGSDLRIVAGDSIEFFESFSFSGPNSADYAGNSRTSLGLPLPALTNTSVTNFRTAIGLGAANNVTFSNITASGTLSVSNTATFSTNVSVAGSLTVGSLATTTPSTWALDATQTAAATNGVLTLPSNANVIRLTNNNAISSVTNGVLGAFYYLVNQATNAVTISNVGGITIDGAQNLTLSPNESATLVATGPTNVSVAARGDLTDVALGGTANTAPSQTADSGSSLMTRELSDARYSFSRWYGANEILSGAQNVGLNPLISGNDTGHIVNAILVTLSNNNTKVMLPVDYRVSGSVKVVSYWTDRNLTNSGTNGDIAVWTFPFVASPTNNMPATANAGLTFGTSVQNTFTANYAGGTNRQFYVMEQTLNFATVTNISATNPMQLKWVELQRRGGDATDTSSDSIYLSGVHIYVP